VDFEKDGRKIKNRGMQSGDGSPEKFIHPLDIGPDYRVTDSQFELNFITGLLKEFFILGQLMGREHFTAVFNFL
jgi:hypothetical protein